MRNYQARIARLIHALIICLNFLLYSCDKRVVETNYEHFYCKTLSLANNERWNNFTKRMSVDISEYYSKADSLKYFLIYCKYDNSLLICYSSGKLISKHKFSSFLKYEVEDSYVHNLDSIYLCVLSNKIILCDTSKIIKVWETDSVTKSKLNNIVVCSQEYFNDFIVYKDQTYLLLSPQEYVSNFKSRLSRSTAAVFNLKADYFSLTDTFAFLPDEYRENFYYAMDFPLVQYISEKNVAYMLVNKDEIFDEIPGYANSTKRHKLKSSEFIEYNNPFNPDSIMYDDYKVEYIIGKTNNCWFKYDKFRKVYYRIYNLPLKFLNEDNSVNSWQDCPFVLSIINEDFKIIKEIRFPGAKYDMTLSIVSKDGLMLRTLSNSKIEFDVYDFKN